MSWRSIWMKTCVFLVLVVSGSALECQEATPASEPPFTVTSIPAGEQIPQPLELLRIEKQMGGPDRTVVEGSVTADRALAYRLNPTAGADSHVRFILGKSSQLYVVKFDFVFNALAGTKACRRLTLDVAVDDPEAEILDLFPQQLDFQEKLPRSLTVKPSALLSGADSPDGLFSVGAIEPRILGRIDGRTLEWIFEAASGGSVSSGTKTVFFVVRLPDRLANAPLSAKFEADIGANLFGRWWLPGTSKTGAAKLAVLLR
jgi:hypothetical protein